VAELRALGVRLVLGPDYLAPLADHDEIYLTPGMRKDLPEIEAARQRGAQIRGEAGVVLERCRAKTIGITGSAGKTTTTTLIGHILHAAGQHVHVGGNIGTPLIEQVETLAPDETVVIELSSFQLQLTPPYSPQIAVWTNLSPNHLDIHSSMDEYIEAKKNIFRYQSATGWLVANWDDPVVKAAAAEAPGRVCPFSLSGDPGASTCAFQREDELVWRHHGVELPTVKLHEIKLVGEHNRENALAAMAAAYLAGAGLHAIRLVLTSFRGVEHRIEPIGEYHGATWYNDSKATSPAETVACLKALPAPIVLIAGGSDKGIPFDPLQPLVKEKVKALVLTGPTAEKIEATVRAGGYEGPVFRARGMEEAVHAAAGFAAPGDAVVLSPACASFDAYRNFEERGKHFKALFRSLL
jgi:UDP-N-acetylmuramoylalanine--D-glutamate ligase